MSWRSVVSRACFEIHGSWSYLDLQGEELWRNHTNSNENRGALCRSLMAHRRGTEIHWVEAKIDGKATFEPKLPFRDGIFVDHPEILANLRSSSFFTYNFGPMTNSEEYIACFWEESLQRWVPLVTSPNTLSLVDWVNVFDHDGRFEDALKDTDPKLDPITHPKSYWSHYWELFMEKFERTQLGGEDGKALKEKKLDGYKRVYEDINSDQKTILWMFSNTKPAEKVSQQVPEGKQQVAAEKTQ